MIFNIKKTITIQSGAMFDTIVAIGSGRENDCETGICSMYHFPTNERMTYQNKCLSKNVTFTDIVAFGNKNIYVGGRIFDKNHQSFSIVIIRLNEKLDLINVCEFETIIYSDALLELTNNGSTLVVKEIHPRSSGYVDNRFIYVHLFTFDLKPI